MRIDHYEIWKPINSGGTANVYLAVDLHNGLPVALKKLKNAMTITSNLPSMKMVTTE